MTSTSVSVHPKLSSSDHAEGYWQFFESTSSPGCVARVPCALTDEFAAFLGAGRMSSTAVDMATWLKVLLGGGRCSRTGRQVLAEETIKRCGKGTERFYERAREHPELSPAVYGHGLSEQAYRGHTIVEHSGFLQGWASRLMFVPEIKLGVFVIVNSTPWGRMACEEAKYAILDNVFGLNRIDWHSRLMAERIELRQMLDSIYKEALGTSSDGTSIPPSKIVGVYTAPGFVTWSFDEAHILSGPPAELVDLLPFPMVWGKIQPLIWHHSGNAYKMCWKFFPDGIGYEEMVGLPLDVEVDVHEDSVKGFGVRGFWGAGKGVPSPSGDTVQQRSEVYFKKVS